VHDFFAMGSDCAIHVEAASEADARRLARAGEAEVRRIEHRYSRYRGDSELARINRVAATGGEIEVDAETAGLLDYAFACFKMTAGRFDITSGLLRSAWDFTVPRLPEKARLDAILPRIGLDKVTWSQRRLTFTRAGMEFDFGGLGKEYAADRAAETCIGLGARHGFVDLGGDIRVIGPRNDGSAWRIGIRHPRRTGEAVTSIEVTAGAVATSGDYERFIEVEGRRYCHILDPRTGWPARGPASVTVLSARCLVAGSLSTAAMLNGGEAGAWLSRLGVRHIVIDADGRCSGTEPPRGQAVRLNSDPGGASGGTDAGSS